MSPAIRFATLVVVLVLIAGCSTNDGASDEPTGTAAAVTTTEAVATTAASATTTTAAPTTTEAASTTTTAPVPEVDEETATAFAAGVREAWDRTERTVGGTAPDLTDEEILAIGASICQYVAANPLAEENRKAARLEAYSQVAAIISEALGVPYDPSLQDAGFDSGIDGRNIVAFKYVIDDDGLCPHAWGPSVYMFSSPWSASASA